MIDMWQKMKTWVLEQVVWAEKNLKDKTGAEKRAAVVAKVDEMLVLPWWAEWADGPVIGWMVDKICERLNWLTDWKFDDMDLTPERTEKLTTVMDAPLVEVKAVAGAEPKSLDDRLAELSERYGLEREKPTPAPKDDFKMAIAFSLKWEGGRNFDDVNGVPVLKPYAKHDKGGPTAYGITIPTLKYAHASGVVKHADICKLTPDEAKAIYRKNFWERYGWGELRWPVSLCCLDVSINHGGFAWILQRACKALGADLAIDGKFGPRTFAALKGLEPKTLAAEIVKQRKAYYEKIVAKDPGQKVHMEGWMKRLDDMARTTGVE